MDAYRPPMFIHSYRLDGHVTSICRKCHAMIANEANEIDLCKSEKAHVCTGLNIGNLLHPENAH